MSSEKRPNILLILADDLGFSDLGCYGSEIQTPNLDKLASEGIRWSDYHTSPLCSPTRSMIMSGTDCHLAGVGVMENVKGFDPKRWDLPGHEMFLNYDVAAMPELLRDAGYLTIMSGKWHLGHRPGHFPHERGFKKCFSLLPGGGNHFGWEPMLAEKGNKGGGLYADDGKRWLPDANVANSKDGFYSTTYFTDRMIQYLDERTPDESTKPFFGFLPFTAPHFPLQAFPEDKAKYKGKYKDGPDVLRQERLARLKELGLIAPDCEAHPVMIRNKNTFTGHEWDELDDKDRAFLENAQETYAAMIDRIDQELGKLFKYLEDSGEMDNTLVLFFSDNGAAGAALEANVTMGPKLLDTIDKFYDNSVENLGNHNSYMWLGPRWAQATTAPNRVYKSYVTEGGIRVPMIMRFPKWLSSKYPPGSICRSFGSCMDLLPTFLDLAGHKHPNPNPAKPTDKAPYNGHMVYPMRGHSWVPYFQDGKTRGESEAEAIWSSDDEPISWEMHGRASIRHGKWKAVNMPADEYGTGEWQLYDMSKDQGEVHDLAKDHPELLQKMIKNFEVFCKETGAVFGPPVDWKGGRKSLKDTIAGDPTDDALAWSKVGLGKRYTDEGWQGPKYEPNGVYRDVTLGV